MCSSEDSANGGILEWDLVTMRVKSGNRQSVFRSVNVDINGGETLRSSQVSELARCFALLQAVCLGLHCRVLKSLCYV